MLTRALWCWMKLDYLLLRHTWDLFFFLRQLLPLFPSLRSHSYSYFDVDVHFMYITGKGFFSVFVSHALQLDTLTFYVSLWKSNMRLPIPNYYVIFAFSHAHIFGLNFAFCRLYSQAFCLSPKAEIAVGCNLFTHFVPAANHICFSDFLSWMSLIFFNAFKSSHLEGDPTSIDASDWKAYLLVPCLKIVFYFKSIYFQVLLWWHPNCLLTTNWNQWPISHGGCLPTKLLTLSSTIYLHLWYECQPCIELDV